MIGAYTNAQLRQTHDMSFVYFVLFILVIS